MSQESQTRKCGYEACNSRPWFCGFNSDEDWLQHNCFHQCQWLKLYENELAVHCLYIPVNEEDLKTHLKKHVDEDFIPSLSQKGTKRWFCPWQTCTSWAYSVKGSISKAHVTEHIATHATVMKSQATGNKRKSPHADNEDDDEAAVTVRN